MSYGNVSAEVTDATIDAVLEKVGEIRALLPFLIGLTPQERMMLPKMRQASSYFVSDALVSAEQNPQLVPPYLDLAEARKDLELFQQLNKVLTPIQQLFEMLDHTTLAVGSEAYAAMLTYYNTAKRAAKDGVPGAEAISDALKSRFKQSSSSEPEVAVAD
ncbi:MAG: hypothetical protein KDA47_08825 [Planctomycetales bacterium]|nr:hypothetical protein [Planctomycetales bacterium]